MAIELIGGVLNRDGNSVKVIFDSVHEFTAPNGIKMPFREVVLPEAWHDYVVEYPNGKHFSLSCKVIGTPDQYYLALDAIAL